MVLLITKYNLSPKGFQVLIFLIVYFILIKIHYIHLNDSLVECMQRSSSFEKDKEILQIAGHFKERSNINSTWNNIRAYFGYERVDTATISNPLKKADLLEKYAECVTTLKNDLIIKQTKYDMLEAAHQGKIKSLSVMEKSCEDQKIQLEVLRKTNQKQTNDFNTLYRNMSEKLSKLESLITQKSAEIIEQGDNNAIFSQTQLSSIQQDLSEVLVTVGTTQTSFDEYSLRNGNILTNFEQEVLRNETLIEEIKKAEFESNQTHKLLQEKDLRRVKSFTNLYARTITEEDDYWWQCEVTESSTNISKTSPNVSDIDVHTVHGMKNASTTGASFGKTTGFLGKTKWSDWF